MKVSFDNVHFYEVKLKVDVDKLGGRGVRNKWHAGPGSCTRDDWGLEEVWGGR